MTQKIIKIEGMHCQHCANRVEKVLSSVEGVTVKVDLANKSASIISNIEITDEELKKMIEFAGYKVTEII